MEKCKGFGGKEKKWNKRTAVEERKIKEEEERGHGQGKGRNEVPLEIGKDGLGLLPGKGLKEEVDEGNRGRFYCVILCSRDETLWL